MVGNPKFGTLGIIMLPLGLLANISGILMFGVLILQFILNTIHNIIIAQGLPLSYILSPHFENFTWFYIPLTAVLLFSLITIIMGVTVMLLGKHISKTPGNLFIGIITYVTIYGFIAPFWLMRSLYDLATGTKRAWR
jgi:hypothetical protein